MAHRAVIRGGRRSAPSLKTWLGQTSPVFGTDLTAGAGLFSPGLKAFGGPGDEDVTILRTRGQINAAIVTTDDTQVFQFFLGMGLCTTEAALAGAVPLPGDNPEWDGWFVHQVMGMGEFATATVIRSTQIIDSKAMRKVPSGQVFFLSTQVFTAVGSSGQVINESIQFRSLLKTS